MPTYIVMIGAPGAGKGTQAQMISKELKLPHISSGDIFRENLKNNTELGRLAKGYMDRGELVPDDVTISMIRERLTKSDCAAGAVLDGFPRTPDQAKALKRMLVDFNGQVYLVPYIMVAEEILIERLTGRWTCKAQGHVYHEKYNPPKSAGICDFDGSELYQRDDDKAETVINRIRVYLQQTAPLIEYYQREGLLQEIDGTQSIDDVKADLMKVIRAKEL